MLNAGNAPVLLPVGDVLVFAVGALNILPGGSVSVSYFQKSASVGFPGLGSEWLGASIVT
jgi:hypothetical protein